MSELALASNIEQARSASQSLLPLKVSKLCYEVDGTRILDGVELQLSRSACTAIMGFNGAGKSVLLRLLHGLLEPSSGSLQWSLIGTASEVRKRQAMVFQTPVLLRRSVAANIRYVLARRGLPRKALAARVDELLAQAHLTDLANRPTGVLSGGERQRVALARALACDPEVLFLDEPTASLDPAATLAIEEILKAAMAAGRKLVLVSQSLGQAQRLADDIVFLHRGKVTEHTAATTFLQSPNSAPAAAFVAGQLMA